MKSTALTLELLGSLVEAAEPQLGLSKKMHPCILTAYVSTNSNNGPRDTVGLAAADHQWQHWTVEHRTRPDVDLCYLNGSIAMFNGIRRCFVAFCCTDAEQNSLVSEAALLGS